MTKRSVKERYQNEQRNRSTLWRRRIKPPYDCSFCGQPHAIWVKCEKIESVETNGEEKRFFFQYKFTVWCQYGCFKKSFTRRSTIYKPVDAYCEAVDQLRKEA